VKEEGVYILVCSFSLGPSSLELEVFHGFPFYRKRDQSNDSNICRTKDTKLVEMTNQLRHLKTTWTMRRIILTIVLLLFLLNQMTKWRNLVWFVVSSTNTFDDSQIILEKVTETQYDVRRKRLSLSSLTTYIHHQKDSCVDPMVWIENKLNVSQSNWTQQRIPLIIHQTSRSRCLHRRFASNLDHWINLPMYEYYFHDDDAIWRLIHQPWPEFPHLHSIIRCLTSMTGLSDIWRLLVLWEYGGIYSDIDSIPNHGTNLTWTPEKIFSHDDAYLLVEYYDAPSQYWMAISPRHPLMFYAVHAAMIRLMQVQHVRKMDVSFVTGPFALLDAFIWFNRDAGRYVGKPVAPGLYYGTNNRSVRLEGYGRARSDDVIMREAIHRNRKAALYESMNMTHFLDDWKNARKSRLYSRTCLATLYDIDIGPPSWFVALPTEDRWTVGGYS
jgi:mannosyltransferase OCH1-like enzyme